MEFLRVAVKRNFNDIVISIKASNTVVMVHTMRLLVDAMNREGMKFPLHLGVTEAGDGEDGRVRSAVGIGTLLAQGIGDTIRVSLSEDPEAEIPVARELINYITARASAPSIAGSYAPGYNAINPTQRASRAIGNVGGQNLPVVVGFDHLDASMLTVDASLPSEHLLAQAGAHPQAVLRIISSHANPVGEISAAIHALTANGITNPIIATLNYDDTDANRVVIHAAADFGALLLNGLIDGIDIEANTLSDDTRNRLALGILQATRRRITRTEFVSCPGCGRTLFDLQSTVHRVKEATAHLKGLKIAVMGCIVNGPGEMADADYGYVGAAVGNVSLYRGKTPVEKNIPSDQALDHLIALLKADGKWVEPKQ
jgi:(E)-4-hydroxy-3-methylbut-2-enyl-diphosphate synthase